MPYKEHISIDICSLIGIYMGNTLNNTKKCLINGINMNWILILTIFQSKLYISNTFFLSMII